MSKDDAKTEEAAISNTGKDIKKGMDKYEAKMKLLGEEPPQMTRLGQKNKSKYKTHLKQPEEKQVRILFSYPAIMLPISFLSAFLRCSTTVDLSTLRCLERSSEEILLGTS